VVGNARNLTLVSEKIGDEGVYRIVPLMHSIMVRTKISKD
jgi:hypothetical protein